MNDHEIIEAMDAVQQLSDQMATRMLTARRQGRMLPIGEAREMDALSRKLLQRVRILFQHPLGEINSPELRRRAGEMLELARKALGLAIQPDVPDRSRLGRRMPRAASSRLDAYCTC